MRRLLPKMVADGQAKNPRYGVYTRGNSGNTTGNTSATVTGNFEGGNTFEPILEPTVTAVTAVTVESGDGSRDEGNGSETARIEAAREAVAESNRVTLLREQVASGRADLEALAGALAAELGGDWKGWRDVARALVDEYGEEEQHG